MTALMPVRKVRPPLADAPTARPAGAPRRSGRALLRLRTVIFPALLMFSLVFVLGQFGLAVLLP